MVNEAHQPTREISVRTEATVSVGVAGVTIARERSATQSAAEQALKDHEQKGK